MIFLNKKIKCVIPCAGEGKRMYPFSKGFPKILIKINDKPILYYVIDYWKKYTNNFIFIVGYKKERIIKFVKTLPINYQFVKIKKTKGIADTLCQARNLVSNNFIVVLGDCIFKGEFRFPKKIDQGIGVWETNERKEIKKSYSVKIKNNLVVEVEEKPVKIFNNLCGMGFYVFNKKVFDYIKLTKPSKLRGEIEITDVIKKMIKSGEKINPIFFKGNYININYPSDIKKAKKILS